MNRLVRYLAAVLIAGSGPACATMSVSSHVAHDLDVSRFHSYTWGAADALPTGDPRLDQNPFFKDHLQGAVERGLAARGLSLSDTPDLLVHYHANITNRIEVSHSESAGACYGNVCDPRVFSYEAGTLVLDIVDARTNQLLWRGWAQRAIGDLLENPDRMAAQIEEAVARMLQRFPRPRPF